VNERHGSGLRIVGLRAASAQSADQARTLGGDHGGQRPAFLSTDRAEATAARHLFGREEVEDAVWMAFAHALPTRAEIVRVARRRGAPSELVDLLERLASPQFAQLADVWEAVDATQNQHSWEAPPNEADEGPSGSCRSENSL